jgi:mRNA-degrading endonuclease RelE of RelBE toxin-antitoxin system
MLPPLSFNYCPLLLGNCICEDMCVFAIRFAEGVEEDLRKTRIYYRNGILDGIEEQLAHEPVFRTKNRKLLENLIPPLQTVTPVWELRVGDYRVFYDVFSNRSVVYVRAVRRKPRGTKTEDIS